MATIIKREVNGKEYHYLSYSYRRGKRILKKERYLGEKIPEFDALVKHWEKFSHEIVRERYFPILEEIFENYRDVINKTPLEIFMKDLRNFGIKFTHHSNKIEGSKLTLREVAAVIDNGIIPRNKPVDDAIETKSHMMIYEKMIKSTEDLSIDLICRWHKEFFHLTKHDEAGIIRNYPVSIKASNYEPPMYKIEIDILLERLFEWYHENKEEYHPVFVAAVMHYRFIAIHPFGDGNGRITRLMTNYILHKNGWPMFDIDPKIRDRYYNALEKADQHEDNELPFILWFFKYYVKINKIHSKIPKE